MRKAKVTAASDDMPTIRPALTPEARENQLIDLAVWRAEQQIRDGTASPLIITHFLKLGTEKYKLEQEKLRRENDLLTEKAESYKSNQRIEELYSKAITAMRRYGGHMNED